jgi:hypothetical protein
MRWNELNELDELRPRGKQNRYAGVWMLVLGIAGLFFILTFLDQAEVYHNTLKAIWETGR